jgi:hypothetical protein
MGRERQTGGLHRRRRGKTLITYALAQENRNRHRQSSPDETEDDDRLFFERNLEFVVSNPIGLIPHSSG